jgi:hypothetical protein
MNQTEAPFSETDILTIPELARRLKADKSKTYDIVSIKGCPLFDIGGDRGKRVIWGDFLDWFRKNFKVTGK